MTGPSLQKYARLTLAELDDAVHEVQLEALQRGMIPIAAIISRPLSDGRHEVLGFGSNELADGVPGVHGETGAIKHMGRIRGGYRDLVATSSLSPCLFCQRTLARHIGIRTIRILDDVNYRPDRSGYARAGITPIVAPHPGIEATFKGWVTDPKNVTLWQRDIGISAGPVVAPRRMSDPEVEALIDRVVRIAAEGEAVGEAPIGALIVDAHGQVVSASAARIIRENDPSSTASMAAWRRAGSRDDWGSHTLVLTHGPDQIALSMFETFGFGQLVVGSVELNSGETGAVQALGRPVVIAGAGARCDPPLRAWLRNHPSERVQEYLGTELSLSRR